MQRQRAIPGHNIYYCKCAQRHRLLSSSWQLIHSAAETKDKGGSSDRRIPLPSLQVKIPLFSHLWWMDCCNFQLSLNSSFWLLQFGTPLSTPLVYSETVNKHWFHPNDKCHRVWGGKAAWMWSQFMSLPTRIAGRAWDESCKTCCLLSSYACPMQLTF